MIEIYAQYYCGTVKFKVALTDRYNRAKRCHYLLAEDVGRHHYFRRKR